MASSYTYFLQEETFHFIDGNGITLSRSVGATLTSRLSSENGCSDDRPLHRRRRRRGDCRGSAGDVLTAACAMRRV
jgi:hypothetical protein